jgi:hypothetical protein
MDRRGIKTFHRCQTCAQGGFPFTSRISTLAGYCFIPLNQGCRELIVDDFAVVARTTFT